MRAHVSDCLTARKTARALTLPTLVAVASAFTPNELASVKSVFGHISPVVTTVIVKKPLKHVSGIHHGRGCHRSSSDHDRFAPLVCFKGWVKPGVRTLPGVNASGPPEQVSD